MLQRADAWRRRGECCTSCGEFVEDGGFYYFRLARVCGRCMRELTEAAEREDFARRHWAAREELGRKQSSEVARGLVAAFAIWAVIAAGILVTVFLR